ncbi:response regulator transcription factor [Novosphingobium sp. TCA1]|uniref:LuxR C-terminal-related transcriptional regulator n=1 Tax=Novosphingobium sp. TCA1 TaxID=2682474 RepID=UPI001309B7F8|nr:response regulator transcription factor [Novosphingobium sp. TCA1]GFE77648.1 DNA-binding response regulator [Novosphingobium sp. TCA1]
MACKNSEILLVDQQEVFRLGTKVTLETHHAWKVSGEAEDGEQAIAIARKLEPDLVILEQTLRYFNGINLMINIKKEMPWINFILYTANSRENTIVEFIKAGVRGIVLKSDDLGELKCAVRRVLAGTAHFSSSISQILLDKVRTEKQQPATLTARERQIVQLISEGNMNKQIAYHLGLSTKTVETHRASVMSKLNFANTA